MTAVGVELGLADIWYMCRWLVPGRGLVVRTLVMMILVSFLLTVLMFLILRFVTARCLISVLCGVLTVMKLCS